MNARETGSDPRGLEDQLHALYMSGIIGILRADRQHIVDANDAFLAMVGYTREELEAGQLNWVAMTPPEYQELGARAVEELARTGSCTPFEKEYIRKDGTRVPILIAATAISHEPLQWVGYVLDLSAVKHAALADRTLETVIEHVPVGIIVVNRDGRLVLMNDAGRRISGALPSGAASVADQVGDFALREPQTGRPLAPGETPIGRALAGEAVTRYEYVFRAPGADRDTWIRAVAAPLQDGAGRRAGAVAVFEDVTEERAREQARDDFLSVAAHDLKGPLTTIKGFTQLLERRLEKQGMLRPEEAGPELRRISRTAVRMERLIGELLDIARLQMGETLDLMRTEGDLVELARRVAEEYAATAEDHVIRVESAEDALIGRWDITRLERVVGNLVANAVAYSPDGGEVRLTLTEQEQEGTPWAVLAVGDQGIGIPERDLPHIFDRFYRGSNVVERFGGSGIGLAGVKQIVEQHGGNVTVESRETQGSTFTVRLPLVSIVEKPLS